MRRVSAIDQWGRVRIEGHVRDVLAILAIFLVNYVTFKAHYRGDATFPWDFLGGYHAQAFGWFDDGGVTSPPHWFPWTNMGLPALLAIQSGAWYLPLALMHLLGIEYTVHAATVFQVLHVFAGAVGVYLLTGIFARHRGVALMLAVAYHFSVTFYSNQEHVDIIRAAAWLPWVLYSLHPSVLLRRYWGAPLAAFVLSQFLVCGYPGNIVSAVYACALWVIVLFFSERGADDRRRFFTAVTIAVLAGVLMGAIKWLPLAINGSTGLELEHLPAHPFGFTHLLTLLSPYQLDSIPGDQTMRSLWIPLVAIWGMCLADWRSQAFRLGAALVVLALAVGILVSSNPWWRSVIPGADASRFALSDWRPVVHLGIVVVSANGWSRLLRGELTVRRAVIGSAVMLLLGTWVARQTLVLDATPTMMARMLTALACVAVLAILAACVQEGRRDLGKLGTVVVTFLVLAGGIDGYFYQRSQSGPWRPGWSIDSERLWLGGEFDYFRNNRGPLSDIIRRPERFVLGNTPEEVLVWRNSGYYNRCWYMRAYCLFGYDNLRISKSHETLLAALAKPGANDLLAFIRRPGQLLVLPVGGDTAITHMDEAMGTSTVVSVNGDANAEDVSYGATEVSYRVYVAQESLIVENEIWWPGWKVSICTVKGDSCAAEIDTKSTVQGLRSWQVPPGTHTVKLRFAGPSSVPGYVSAGFGLLLLLLLMLWPRSLLPSPLLRWLPPGIKA